MVHRMLSVVGRGVATLSLLVLSPAFLAAQTSDSPEITELLNEAKTHAVMAENDAIALESYTFSKLSTETDATRLNQMKEHANNLIEEFNKLGTLKSSGSPWQQEAIDRVRPLLHDMSTHLTATINHFNENRNQVSFPPYRDYVKANRQYMVKTARLISDFVDYGETKAEAEAFERALELPTTAKENP